MQLRTVAPSAIVALDGWNPRMSFDDAELLALSASMVDRGCLVPVILQATGDGAYRLVDGEKRYKADPGARDAYPHLLPASRGRFPGGRGQAARRR